MGKVTAEVWSSLSHLLGAGRPRRCSFGVEKEGTTLAALLRRVAGGNSRFAEAMYKPNTSELSGQVSVVVNGRLPELLDGYQTKLHDKDRIILVQAYAGD